jgi:DNA-binding MarR family transcriptional regulator
MVTTAVATAPTLPLAAQLSRATGRLRRSLNRRVRTAIGSPPIPEAQLEVLRVVEAAPGARVHDVARQLGLASNTVSTLVHRLIDTGLLEREADRQDGRVARLRLTTQAAARLRRWRDQRHEILALALDQLGEPDRRALVSALPVQERLADALEMGTHAPVGPPPGGPGGKHAG